MESLQPQNYLEEQLAGLIALGLWRRWRIERHERHVLAVYRLRRLSLRLAAGRGGPEHRGAPPRFVDGIRTSG